MAQIGVLHDAQDTNLRTSQIHVTSNMSEYLLL
jgi:hypothetical protein